MKKTINYKKFVDNDEDESSSFRIPLREELQSKDSKRSLYSAYKEIAKYDAYKKLKCKFGFVQRGAACQKEEENIPEIKTPKKEKRFSRKSMAVAGGLAIALGAAAAIAASKKVNREEEIVSAPILEKDPESKEKIGEGVFGEVYITSNNTAFKKAKESNVFDKSEVNIAKEIGDIGLAPKILGITTNSKGITGYEMEFLNNHKTVDEILKDPSNRDKSFDSSLSAIFKLHDQGVIHGDLHGMNIMQNSSKETKLIDFGIASKIKNIENPSDDDLGRWSLELISLGFAYDTNPLVEYHDLEEERLKSENQSRYNTPVQKVFQKTLELSGRNKREAYNYYKKEMKKYV